MGLELYLEKYKKEIAEQLAVDQMRIVEEYEMCKEDCIKKCKACIEELFKKCIEKQKGGEKDLIAFVGVHFLRTSARTGSLEYKIALYGEGLFQDKIEVSVYWEPPYLRKITEETLKKFSIMLKKECIRIASSDIKSFCEEYVYELMKFVPKEITECLKELCKSRDVLQLAYTEKIRFLMGEYMQFQEEFMSISCI